MLADYYAPQNWWPTDHAFEVVVGAVLTQITSWRNVELALSNLRNANLLAYDGFLDLEYNEARTIVDYRDRHGHFKFPQDPAKIKVSGRKLLRVIGAISS